MPTMFDDELFNEKQFDASVEELPIADETKKNIDSEFAALIEGAKDMTPISEATPAQLIEAYWRQVAKSMPNTSGGEFEAMTGYLFLAELEYDTGFHYQITHRGSPALVRGLFMNLGDYMEETFYSQDDDDDD